MLIGCPQWERNELNDKLRNSHPIFMINCPFAEVSDGCRAEFIGLIAWRNIKDAENNISLSDFHQAILYGFELHYYLRSSPQRISKVFNYI
ncbi:hypothetical protein H5410_008212 [Solanum commersonii]|uniref:Uncharacterized protein n=1 Tax=Solanum commersonii TaxID=4109 RepID=A0A9J6AFX3_SOLCO|nr:hypothetical protein H5410_008212 [Solanum commersonii]